MADIGMCVTGLTAALTTSSYLLRWVVNNESTVADMAPGLGSSAGSGAAPADD